MLAIADKNPAGPGVYFVRGDATDTEDLHVPGSSRIGRPDLPDRCIRRADMHSILIIMAIKSVAPQVAPWPR